MKSTAMQQGQGSALYRCTRGALLPVPFGPFHWTNNAVTIDAFRRTDDGRIGRPVSRNDNYTMDLRRTRNIRLRRTRGEKGIRRTISVACKCIDDETSRLIVRYNNERTISRFPRSRLKKRLEKERESDSPGAVIKIQLRFKEASCRRRARRGWKIFHSRQTDTRRDEGEEEISEGEKKGQTIMVEDESGAKYTHTCSHFYVCVSVSTGCLGVSFETEQNSFGQWWKGMEEKRDT